MDTHQQIKKKEQCIARLERKLALERIKKRKTDTRRKIEYGGLVIKAHMHAFSKEVILGALLHAQNEIQQDSGAQSLYRSLGKAAFMGYQDHTE